jgi:hypothetical protein
MPPLPEDPAEKIPSRKRSHAAAISTHSRTQALDTSRTFANDHD